MRCTSSERVKSERLRDDARVGHPGRQSCRGDRLDGPRRQRVSQSATHDGGRLHGLRSSHGRDRRTARARWHSTPLVSERSGDLPAEDILRLEHNLEDSNFTPREQIEVITDLAANPRDGLPPVTLQITEQQLAEEYRETQHKAHEDPGKAGVLLSLAEDPANGGPVRISKPEFARALAERILNDLAAVRGDEAREQLYARRPLLRFTLDRIAQPLADVRW